MITGAPSAVMHHSTALKSSPRAAFSSIVFCRIMVLGAAELPGNGQRVLSPVERLRRPADDEHVFRARRRTPGSSAVYAISSCTIIVRSVLQAFVQRLRRVGEVGDLKTSCQA